MLCQHVEVRNLAGQFQVRVREAAVGVGGRDELGLDQRFGEPLAPDEWGEARIPGEPDAFHSCAASVGGSDGNREVGNHLAEARGSRPDIECQVV